MGKLAFIMCMNLYLYCNAKGSVLVFIFVCWISVGIKYDLLITQNGRTDALHLKSPEFHMIRLFIPMNIDLIKSWATMVSCVFEFKKNVEKCKQM